MDEFKIKNILFSLSAAAYGEPKRIPIPEDQTCKPTNSYDGTKYIFEKLLELFVKKEK
jgi:UDP-glucose 4-epimerase